MPLKNSFPVSLPIPDLEPPLQGYCHLLMRGETQTDPPVAHYSTKPDSISNRKIPVSIKLLAKCDTFAPTQAFLLIRLAKLAFLLDFAAFRAPPGPPIRLGRRTNQAATQCFAFMRGPRPLGEGSRRIANEHQLLAAEGCGLRIGG